MHGITHIKRKSINVKSEIQISSIKNLQIGLIPLISIIFLLTKKMSDFYRSYAAESKHGKEIAPSPTTFERVVFEFKKHIFSKIHIW
jgi:hypothetical protein